jgi:hypothetical protein
MKEMMIILITFRVCFPVIESVCSLINEMFESVLHVFLIMTY